MIAQLAIALTMIAPGAQAQAASGASTRPLAAAESPKPVIDNERVTVWDLSWTADVPAILNRQTNDTVWVTVTPTPGTVTYFKKGQRRHALARPEAGPSRTIVIELKDHPVTPIPNPTGLPLAFPRTGSRKALENRRVVVWDYTWTPGKPTPMHFHDKDVVVVFLRNGSLRSTTTDGKVTTNHVSPGLTQFNARNRAHSELLVEGESRVIATELK